MTARARMLLLGCAAAATLWCSPAGAQTTVPADDPDATAPEPETEDPAGEDPAGEEPVAGQQIRGRLTSAGEPVAGVRITVEGVDPPGFSDETESDDEGNWSVPVPGPGVYRVALDTDTMPEGVALADPDRFELPRFRVFAGTTAQNAVFRFDARAESASRFDRLINLFAGGIRFGLIIGVSSVGLSLIYGTTNLVNFAHGELVTIGALLAWFWSTSAGGPTLSLGVASLIAVLLCGVFGGALELGLWRPMRRRQAGRIAAMLVSIGLALFLRYTYQLVYGGNPRSYRQYATQPPFEVGPISFPARDYWIIIVCVIVLVGVGVALQKTRLGTAVRAVADEHDLAASSGIDVRRVVLVVWVSGAALAGLGGILFGLSQGVQWNMGFRLLLTMFAAVVLGGLGSAYGAMAGGLVVGIASEMSTYWISADFKFAVALGVLILVLLVRPQGLLGVRERIG